MIDDRLRNAQKLMIVSDAVCEALSIGLSQVVPSTCCEWAKVLKVAQVRLEIL